MYDLRIVVEEIKGFCDMPMQCRLCRQCGTASCVNACPTGALTKEPEARKDGME